VLELSLVAGVAVMGVANEALMLDVDELELDEPALEIG
jgi:hypothetical protein